MLIFLILFVLFAFVAEQVSLRYALDRVSYDTYPTRPLVEIDEPFTIHTIVKNDKRMPVPFVRMIENLPADLKDQGGQLDLRRDRDCTRLHSSFFLMPRQQLDRAVWVSLGSRGRHFLRGGVLQGGDFLGLSEAVEHYQVLQEIVVMPQPLDCPSLTDTLGGFLGDISVNRFILEDPVLTLGFREYTGREPQKSISWSQSARMGRLMVKNYDHTLELSVTVLLNIECEDAFDAGLAETCFSLARSVCEQLERTRVKYSFMTNAIAAGSIAHWASIGEGLGPSHVSAILEGLGRATYDRSESFGTLLYRAAQSSEQGRSHIVITPRYPVEYASGLKRLRDLTGGQVCVLAAQDYAPAGPSPQEEAAS